ncbi:MAG: hypothetical protein NC905_03395 [Candidatus Omnitrophica bacterium]|nr:hypothetical protein [Candidatus Omnitrophota bacterium]MCM8777291.1 hypothetical protein [Candidatus Omnitrophota bacterium]
MRICSFYLQGEKVIYRLTGTKVEEGDINSGEVESFLDKNRPDMLNIIISKPQIIFRRIEFPFTNRKKIHMIIPSELEETLPESIDKLDFSFDFFSLYRNKTIVNVYAIPSELCNFWSSQAKKYRAKLYFFADTLLFYQFLTQSIDKENYIAIYREGEYLLLNIIENKTLTGSYSWELTQSTEAENIALIKEILEKKNFPLFICASQEIGRELGISGEKVQYISLPTGMEKRYLFHHLSSLRVFRRPFLPLKLSSSKKISVFGIALLFGFLIISFLLFSPYLKVIDKQKKLTRIEEDMRQIFASAFPDVKNIVNPLIQAREKITKIENTDIKTGVSSVLEIMAEITLLFPENIDVKVDLLRIAGDTLTLSGTTDSLKTLEKIKSGIEKSDRFTIIDIGTISFDSKNRANFSITLKVN